MNVGTNLPVEHIQGWMARLFGGIRVIREACLGIIIIPTTFATLFAMGVLIVLALLRMTRGILLLWSVTESSSDTKGLAEILHGLDLLLVAPVGYMASLGVGEYLLGVDKPNASAGLVSTKSFVVGLMVAALAVKVVEDLLSEPPASWERVAMYCLAIAVLGAYSLLSEALVKVLHRVPS